MKLVDFGMAKVKCMQRSRNIYTLLIQILILLVLQLLLLSTQVYDMEVHESIL